MFTGIVQQLGIVERLARGRGGARLRVSAALPGGRLALGESIAVDGVCLTAAKVGPRTFEADLSAETLQRTTAGVWERGRRVNLERALAAGARFGGHLVQGHVDDTGTVVSLRRASSQATLRVRFPSPLAPLIAGKGSIAVDGVSLTVNEVGRDWFQCALIPHTLAGTCLGERRPGDRVNLEADLLARYLARLLEGRGMRP